MFSLQADYASHEPYFHLFVRLFNLNVVLATRYGILYAKEQDTFAV